MYELKPDYEKVSERFEAWWRCEIVDRTLASIVIPKVQQEQTPLPTKSFSSLKDKWLDSEFQAEFADALLSNHLYLGDALPITYPNLGPEIFSAYYGCELEYGEDTAWSKPILESMSIDSINSIILDENNFYFKKTTQMTECLLERGKGHFIVGYTDLHPNGDAIAAFRDPQRLLLDTIEYKEEIKILSRKITRDFLKVYDIFHKQISKYGMPSTCWLPAISKGKFHIPSCDISCMISNEAFENLFLESIIEECRYMDNNIYHLDGPQALRYLDTLLDIPEIHAIQWVPGAGQDYWANWIEVYQKIQNKNKAMYILSVPAQDLDKLFEILRPEGVWIGNITEVQTIEQANEILNKIERWG